MKPTPLEKRLRLQDPRSAPENLTCAQVIEILEDQRLLRRVLFEAYKNLHSEFDTPSPSEALINQQIERRLLFEREKWS